MSRRERKIIELTSFGGPEVLRWTEDRLPEPGPDDTVVEIDALGLNFADVMVRRGEYRREQPLDFTPGFEAAGRVLESPPGGLEPGRRVVVFTPGGRGYADLQLAAPDRVFPIDEEVPATVAAGIFIAGTTAWYALHRFGELQAGETVLVNAGAGGVGALAIQLAVAAGARAIASASSEEKLEKARSHGASDAFLADPETLAAEVREATGGRGVDVVVDGVGGPLFAPSLAALGFHGRYVVVGSASQQPGTLDTRALLPRNQSVIGFVTARIVERDPAEPQRAIDAVFAAYAAGQLRPEVAVLPAAEVARAHQLLESRERTGTVVLDLGGGVEVG